METCLWTCCEPSLLCDFCGYEPDLLWNYRCDFSLLLFFFAVKFLSCDFFAVSLLCCDFFCCSLLWDIFFTVNPLPCETSLLWFFFAVIRLRCETSSLWIFFAVNHLGCECTSSLWDFFAVSFLRCETSLLWFFFGCQFFSVSFFFVFFPLRGSSQLTSAHPSAQHVVCLKPGKTWKIVVDWLV